MDLLFSVEKGAEKLAKEPIRSVVAVVVGLRFAGFAVTRPPGECERLDAANPEFALALLDLRRIGGDEDVFARAAAKSVSRSCALAMARRSVKSWRS